MRGRWNDERGGFVFVHLPPTRLHENHISVKQNLSLLFCCGAHRAVIFVRKMLYKSSVLVINSNKFCCSLRTIPSVITEIMGPWLSTQPIYVSYSNFYSTLPSWNRRLGMFDFCFCGQVESHPYLAQVELMGHCRDRGLIMTAYSPLGSPDRAWKHPDEPVVLEEPLLVGLAKKYKKSPAQIVLRWFSGKS